MTSPPTNPSPAWTSPDRRPGQVTLTRVFWSTFVIALLFGFIRLLAETAGSSFAGVLLLAAPAIGTAVTLVWEPRTWIGGLTAATPIVLYYFALPWIITGTDLASSETPFSILLIGSWLTMLGCCGARLYLTSFQSLLGEVLLVWIVFVPFCCGLPTMV
ncbi:hypothetical protein LOC68_23310 [Blastopirellula sp. JC732]|uniref:Uncharacterized protein n=1 Tax=Blastopirellula sediminis TaxID=2894196 RepID=A0A9X1SI96_9BACT|nr:hypothetical protein [Blastopirellula sediminis]MCC9605367.1 hypothetical protein [Blastopirellula sediminis]MCC9631333.1 hypothetical protein [Blastopirellula sediminis]